ncbi:hypothetical protein [Polaribacter sp. IC073]|uniref:hypothetical protein n=1 Tax=Polaribacter sp. IC073 TaxID=2508540 RepID=UPI0011BE57F1|nr:hypothetical protein [Polaribacter sp. IC073]TXD47260.1 hypothetical protein ES045_11710 [Polaribacter sp. IC073]
MKKGKVLNLYEDTNLNQNAKEKYSTLLEKFIAPFTTYFEEFEYHEDIFEFAINSWNLGNMKSILNEKEFEEIISTAKDDDEINYPLFKKMILYKVSNFKEFTDFIVDFDVKLTDKIMSITVATEEEDNYMTKMLLGELDTELITDDFGENFVNRSAISLKPAQPFIDWHNTIYPDSKISASDLDEVTTYLIDNGNSDDIDAYLKKDFDRFFMTELEGWYTDENDWPKKRTYNMFKKWFQIATSTAVYDLEKTPLSKGD